MEFAYFNKQNKDIKLDDNIKIINEPSSERFLVANDDSVNAVIVAREIDFFINNYKGDDLANKVAKLYEARAVMYDYSNEISLNANIGKNICILYDDDELKQALQNAGYKAICVSEYEFYYGGIGTFVVLTSNGEIDCDLALNKDYVANNKAIICTKDLSTKQIIDILDNMTSHIEFIKNIEFNDSLCQLHNRRSTHCGWCVDACPTTALSTDENQIILSEIDCIACARCVSVCPTNALECSAYTKDGIWQSLKLYENEQIIILDDYSKNVDLAGFLPFDIRFNLLDELILLHLVNVSKKAVLIIGEINEFLASKIKLINDIVMAICGKQAIYVNVLASKVPSEEVQEFYASASNFRLNKRELLSLKLKEMIKSNDYGKITAKTYAKININKDSCTLCSSCVAACNTSALIANTKTNSIEFNASLCTSCGYCINSCAEENTISIEPDILELKPSSFDYEVLASDELIACIECGKEFATKKSVEKIVGILGLSFSTDITKKYSLYCCGDCKAKIMMLKQANALDDLDSFFAPLEDKLSAFLKDNK